MSAADPFDPRRDRAERLKQLVRRLGWMLTAPLLLVAALRILAPDATYELVALNALTQWLYLPAWLLLAAALWGRLRGLALANGVLVLLQVWWVDPRGLVAVPPPPKTAQSSHLRLRVMSANLLMINDDTEGISGEVLSAAPDLLLVQELSPVWLARFEGADMLASLPHRRAVARTDSFGIAVYSRLPLTTELLELSGLPAIRADVQLGAARLRVFNFHTLPPRTPHYFQVWNEMMAQVLDLARESSGPLLVGGDLNTTPHQAWFRRLLASGVRGAHEDAGRALATTWPNGRLMVPPIRLDHLLVSEELRVLSVREGEGRGSDHQPVIADLQLVTRPSDDANPRP